MNDTICAISTSLGVGAISIIRVSGSLAIKTVSSIFTKDLTKCLTHTIHYGYIKDKEEIIDEVLVSVFRAPKTYTKEDIVEINTHGGISSTKKVLELLQSKGLRLATPGEFTKRAFLNGRIDLTEAESVESLIKSETDLERQLSLNGVNGKISHKIKNIKNIILDLMANIEVNIDFPEYQDNLEITLDNLKPKLLEIKEELTTLLNESKIGTLIKQGIKVAIVGRPNVGKSSILNHFLGTNKAIVTDIAGTTRDTVEGAIELKGIRLNFIDTAGIHETKDVVEQLGVTKSLEVISNADLIIQVLNNNEPLTKDDKSIMNEIKDKLHITFVNKSDLENKLPLKKDYILGNTITDNGLDNLKAKIIELFDLEKISNSNLEFISSVRVISLLKEALSHINDSLASIETSIPVDMIAIDISAACRSLDEITGEVYEEDLLNKMFSNFCLGK